MGEIRRVLAVIKAKFFIYVARGFESDFNNTGVVAGRGA